MLARRENFNYFQFQAHLRLISLIRTQNSSLMLERSNGDMWPVFRYVASFPTDLRYAQKFRESKESFVV